MPQFVCARNPQCRNLRTGEWLCDDCAREESGWPLEARKVIEALRHRVAERTRSAFLAHRELDRRKRGGRF